MSLTHSNYIPIRISDNKYEFQSHIASLRLEACSLYKDLYLATSYFVEYPCSIEFTSMVKNIQKTHVKLTR